MGMESFFVKIVVSNDESKSNEVFNNSLIEYLNAGKFKTKKIPRFVLIDDLIEMEVIDNSNFYEIALVGCFSCFSVSCNLINDLTNTLFMHYSILSVNISGKEVALSKCDFTEILYEEYREKYQWFKANLTDKTFNASPSTFYKKLKRTKRWLPWRRE